MYCYFEDSLKEVLSPFIPAFSSKPSVILALASESSLMQFSKLFAWAKPTKLSPLQNRKMKVVVEMGRGLGVAKPIKTQWPENPFQTDSLRYFFYSYIMKIRTTIELKGIMKNTNFGHFSTLTLSLVLK